MTRPAPEWAWGVLGVCIYKGKIMGDEPDADFASIVAALDRDDRETLRRAIRSLRERRGDGQGLGSQLGPQEVEPRNPA